MTTRKNTDPQRDAFMLAQTPAQAARVLGVPGKWLRDILRKQGTYVSRGDAFTDEVKAALYDAAHARIAARTVKQTSA